MAYWTFKGFDLHRAFMANASMSTRHNDSIVFILKAYFTVLFENAVLYIGSRH